jgi:hypothetical protein
MELIILIIFKVHANDNTHFSLALTELPTKLHLFQLDNHDMSYIDRCIKQTLISKEMYYATKYLVKCFINEPMHPN